MYTITVNDDEPLSATIYREHRWLCGARARHLLLQIERRNWIGERE